MRGVWENCRWDNQILMNSLVNYILCLYYSIRFKFQCKMYSQIVICGLIILYTQNPFLYRYQKPKQLFTGNHLSNKSIKQTLPMVKKYFLATIL